MGEDGRILSANPAAERIFGYAAEEIIGHPLTMLMPERYRSQHETGIHRYLQTGTRNIAWTGLELPGLTKDGSEIPLEISFGEFTIDDHHVFTGIARDISERVRAREERDQLLAREREAREKAQAADHAKSQFLATMSHEIRTPINAIVGYADLLHAGISGELNQAQCDYLDRIRASSAHLLTLIEDILDLSKVEAGQLEVGHERALLLPVIEQSLRLIRPQAEQKGLAIVNTCPQTEAGSYFGDEDRVRQILLNLLSNATKFTDAGSITVSCGTSAQIGEPSAGGEPQFAWIRVADTGIGIASAQLGSIFDPFVQADATHTRKRGGTGLGLTISRKLAWLMGGDLTVQSNPDKGSAFTLWLPCEPATVPGLLQYSPVAGRSVAPVGKVLVASAEEIVQEHMRRIRLDPEIPTAGALDEADLQDHAATFLADIGQMLVALDASAPDTEMLIRDGSAIQRLISDLHGAQRCRLGWSESALRREFAILRELAATTIERHDYQDDASVTHGVNLVEQMLNEAERISVRGWRLASK